MDSRVFNINSWMKSVAFPIRGIFLMCVILDVILILFYLNTDFAGTYSYTYAPFLKLLVECVLLIINAVLILNILAYLFAVIFQQLILSKETSRYFSFIQYDDKNILEVRLHAFTKPLLGRAQIGIEFEDSQLQIQVYDLSSLQSKIPVPLDHINKYTIKSIHLYIEDMFHFFRIKRGWNYTQSIVQYPVTLEDFNQKVRTKKHLKADDDHSDVKIYSPGEWLNFKQFENGDDVKRILWKVYAKNKMLMVRHQEPLTHDNSEAHIYVGFHIQSLQTFFGNKMSQNFVLDVYKNVIWNLAVKTGQEVSKTIFHLPSCQHVTSLTDFKNKLVEQQWLSDVSWKIGHQSSTLIISDTMSLAVMEAALMNHSNAIYRVVMVESAAYRPEPKYKKWLRNIFFKKQFFSDRDAVLINSEHLHKNRIQLLDLFKRYAHISVEIIQVES